MPKKNILFFLLWISLLAFPLEAQEVSYNETHIKAAYIRNFLKYVSFDNINQPLVLCIIEDDVLGASLAVFEEEKASSSFKIVKKYFNSNFQNCNVLYISESSKDELDKILFVTKHLTILTISDIPGFINKGGLIGFMKKDGRLTIEINNTYARQKKIVIESKLLKIADRVL